MVANDPPDIEITHEGRIGNIVNRSIEFVGGTTIALPTGSFLFFDSPPVSCDAQIAFAKSNIVSDLISGTKLSDLPEFYVSMALDMADCTQSEDAFLCSNISEGLFGISNISPNLADRLLAQNAPVIRVQENWASTITYVFDTETRILHQLYYERI
ncbi:MAG: hypothetical protein ABJH45_17015 [Paracoccaceae bacterium]